MKAIKYILSVASIFLFLGCIEDDNDLSFLDTAEAPSEVMALFQIKQDNSGLVTITPNASNAVSYNITFGDGTNTTVSLAQGENVQHTYVEGNYNVGIEAIGITGLKTVITQELVVSFRAPENLVINTSIDSSNPFIVNVSASADYATSFEVYFDTSNVNEVATPLQINETVSFEYPTVGDYTIRVVALSGGTETTEATQVVTVASPVELPIDFEIFDASKFIGFGGVSASVVQNPDTNGNSSQTVAKMVKGAPEVWAGAVLILSSPIDFTNKEVIKMNVWSPRAGGKLLFKLENLDDPNTFVEKEVTLSGNSTWEEVAIDFSDIDKSKSYQKLVWFFDFGTVGNGGSDWTFYLDNIKQDFAGVVISQMVQDFEGAAPTFTVFGNIAQTQVVNNPDMSGINTSAKVAQLTKTNGSEVWAGNFFEVSTPLDFDSFSQIRIKTWSPKAGITVKLKLENIDASITHEVDMTTTVANQWESLLYDFSGAPVANYVRIVTFFDFGNAGDGSVYYYDDIELVGTQIGVLPLGFQDFEGAAPSFTVFGNIAATQVIANPDKSSINTTNNVAQLTKSNGSEVWAGTFFEVSTPLDFNTYTNISVETWSPKSGIVVKLKLENADASVTYEMDLNTSVSNSWEELIYDFSGAPAADYVRVVIFFDFGNAGDDSVYYFDEFKLTI